VSSGRCATRNSRDHQHCRGCYREANKEKLEGVFRNIDFNSEAALGRTRRRNERLKNLLDDFSDRNYLYVHVPDKRDTERIKELLDDWYTAQVEQILAEHLAACYPKVVHLGIEYPELAIRVMKSRWGSTSPSGRIALNVKLIQVPKTYIDYVVFHELCHLKESNHGSRYYELLDRVLPDWRERREKLNAFEFG
jgi:predicted metal-dependent hydrolase